MQKKEDYFSKELLFCLRVSDAGFDDEDYIRNSKFAAAKPTINI